MGNGPLSKPREEDRDQRYVRHGGPKTEMQRAFIEALDAGEVQRIALTRPAMEAGESISYLPGSLQEK